MAERVGFEPTERFPVHSISSAASSTTPAPLQALPIANFSFRWSTGPKSAIGNRQFLWRRGWDSNPRWALTHSGFRDRCTNPLCDLSACLFGSPASEKLLHQRTAFLFQDARANLNSMIQKICVADSKVTYHCACAFIRRAVNQTPYTRLYQSSGAHRARFNRRVNIDARQPVVAQHSRGLAEGNDFSVGCRIAVCTRAIPGNGDEFVFADDASADGHFAAHLRLASSGKSLPHPVFVTISLRGSRHRDLRPSNNERPL
jgi:hypothetical protein